MRKGASRVVGTARGEIWVDGVYPWGSGDIAVPSSTAPRCAGGAEPLAHHVSERRHVQSAKDGDGSEGADGDGEDGDLTSLVRRWVAAARKADPPSSPSLPSPLPSRVARTHSEQGRLQPRPGPVRSSYIENHRIPTIEIEPSSYAARRREWRPRREASRRLAVLIDAQNTPPDAASDLFEMLGEYGTIGVCRAYADWSKAEVGDWFIHWRRHGIQPFHHFVVDEHVQDEQALVALAIDAVDILRESAVDLVVIVGDLRSTVPLVNRLHAPGLEVLAVGPDDTPDYVRAAYDEFIDISTLTERPSMRVGKHRA